MQYSWHKTDSGLNEVSQELDSDELGWWSKKGGPPIENDIPWFFAIVCNERTNKNCIVLHIIAAWYIFEYK